MQDAINFGAVGMAAFKLGAAFLPKQTRDKFLPHRSTFELAEFAKEDLPRRFGGGTCRCNYCREHIDKHTCIVSVSARGSSEVRVSVAAADVGGTAAWSIDCGGYDVGVTVRFEPSSSTNDGGGAGEGGDEITAAAVAGAALETVEVIEACGLCIDREGAWKVTAVGTFVLALNNEHAWLRSKSVAWAVAISAPPRVKAPSKIVEL